MMKNYGELVVRVEEWGFLPLFRCELQGFSVEELSPPELWWTGEETDPWSWRQLAARDGRLAYGKLFHGRAGFLSPECLPDFCNFRREGYDFDSLYEEGLVSRRLKAVMDQLS